MSCRLPAGNRFFFDPERECLARSIDWALDKGGDSAIFATLTFKDYVSPVRAGKMARRWLARAEQSLKDSGSDSLKSNRHRHLLSEGNPTVALKGNLKSFCATEWQQREVIHFHLLLIGNGLGSLSRKRLESRWEAMGGGFARCYEADRKAAPYLAKYTSKDLGGDVEWGGTWRGLSFPVSVSRTQVGAPTGA
ncbi:hypothetical protein ES708_21912 [subsurface metagenome]